MQRLESNFYVKKVSMKTRWKTLCLSGYFILVSIASAMAQCGTLQSITYDTTVAGTGNNSHIFSLSKFDPSVGTLMSAKINSVISVNYGFTLKNVENVQRDFSVGVGRYDNFSSSALATPFTNLMNIPLGIFPLDPGNSISHSPSTILSKYVQSDSVIYDMVNFMGNGTIDYNYTPITYTNLTGSNVYYYSATASDTIRFSITYFYCTATVLPVSITDFFAKKQDEKTIQLSWKISNEMAGSMYVIQKSNDGNIFTEAGSETSLANDNLNAVYSYNYQLKADDKIQLYFRIKIINASGADNYSEIREVNLKNFSGNISLYPNPSSDFININFGGMEFGSWQANIYSANGILLQSGILQSGNNSYVKFLQKFPAGIYFMRLVNAETKKTYIKSFTIQ